MPAQRKILSTILTWVAGGITITASVLGIAAMGWYAAIVFHAVDTKMESLLTSSNLHELKLINDELRKQLEANEKKLEAVSRKLSVATSQPSDKDWEVTNFRLLEMYSDVIKTNAILRKAGISPLPLKLIGSNAEAMAELVKACGILDHRQANFNAVMVGANLMTSIRLDDKEYVTLTKYPKYAVCWETGEMKLREK